MSFINFDTDIPTELESRSLKETFERAKVGFVLDESGSMVKYKDETIRGFNSYVNQLKEELPGARFTFITFHGNVEHRSTDKPIDETLPLNRISYRPHAGTPLIDSTMHMIQLMEKQSKADPNAEIVIVVQTDGEENTSRKFNIEQLKNTIMVKKHLGWRFILLTCGFDPHKLANSMGFDIESSVEYGGDKTTEAFLAASRVTTQSVKKEEKAAFSLEDKRRLK